MTDEVVREMIRSNSRINMRCSSNEIVINCNLRYDWEDLPAHLRFFRLNSTYVGRESKSFVVLKKKFIYAWKEDLQDYCANASASFAIGLVSFQKLCTDETGDVKGCSVLQICY
jgi:hypothetical protein